MSSPSASAPAPRCIAWNVESTSGMLLPMASRVTPIVLSLRPSRAESSDRFGEKKSPATNPSALNSTLSQAKKPKTSSAWSTLATCLCDWPAQ